MKRNYLYVALMLLAACAALNVPAPQNFKEREAAALITATGAISTGRLLYAANKITADDLTNTIKQADIFMEALNVAEAIHAVDPAQGDAKLAAAVIGLNALNAYLATRK